MSFVLSDAADLDVQVRLYIQYSGTAPTNANLSTFAAACAAQWNTDLAGSHCTVVALTGVNVEDLTSATSAIGSWSGSHSGTTATPALPASVAALVNMKVARRYRGGKPRSYWPAGASGNVGTAQTWSSGFQTAWNTDYNAFIAGILAAPWSGATLPSVVNVSYYKGFTPFETPSGRYKNIPTLRAGGPVVDPILSFTLNSKFGSQRRRVLA